MAGNTPPFVFTAPGGQNTQPPPPTASKSNSWRASAAPLPPAGKNAKPGTILFLLPLNEAKRKVEDYFVTMAMTGKKTKTDILEHFIVVLGGWENYLYFCLVCIMTLFTHIGFDIC